MAEDDKRQRTFQEILKNVRVGGNLTVGNITQINEREKPERPRNEQSFLEWVKQEQVGKSLEVLHTERPIALRKQLQPEQVSPLSKTFSKTFGKSVSPLSESATILEIFDRTDIVGKLLILGEPGSGKTITLLELAQGLVQRAEADTNFPIPVLFNLSFWKDARQSITEWVVEQLQSYGVSKKLSKEWVDNCQLLPLFDGLDEVKPELQTSCVQAINQWLQKEYRLRLVVCCRREEYEKVTRGQWQDDTESEEETSKSTEETRLHLNSATLVQALTDDQIQEYLAAVNQSELWQTLEQDADLLEWVRTPLFLSVLGFIASHQKLSIQHWQTLPSTETRLQYLFDAYWEAVMERELVSPQMRSQGIKSQSYEKHVPPDRKQTRHWLVFLAQRLQRESQTEFLIEKIQFHWVSASMRMNVKLIQLSFQFFIILPAIFWAYMRRDSPQNYSISPLEITLMVLAIISMLISVPFAEIFDFTKDIFLTRKLYWSWRKAILNFIKPLIYGSTFGVSIGLMAGLTSQLKLGETSGVILGFSVGCLATKIFFSRFFEGFTDLYRFILFNLLEAGFLSIKENLSIRLSLSVTALSWIEKYIKLALQPIICLFGYIPIISSGFILAIAGFWGTTQNTGFVDNLKEGVINGILLGLTTGFLCLCTTGWEEVKEIEPGFPGKGVKTSLQHFVIVSTTFLLVFAFVTVIFCFFQPFLLKQQSNGTYYVFSVGIGLLFGLMISWQEAPIKNATIFIRHAILRFILWLDGSIPWNYARFLDYCTERLLLQRIGGRYRFIHKLLQDHFAEMGRGE
ncbi:NACHT domain-containing protein [Kovacikia minuta CCNUW1]|uniref:NACHT domain-containing protein n=1 Tax=Kovacikia minuta TaxID=2931930 RepID=UPI001CCE3D76|nr:NACHT domain-containing protein [Kovacikia minuta]UBF25001.1 NACHT domain-containing protein [Kovacikia minuta CCNUW1]